MTTDHLEYFNVTIEGQDVHYEKLLFLTGATPSTLNHQQRSLNRTENAAPLALRCPTSPLVISLLARRLRLLRASAAVAGHRVPEKQRLRLVLLLQRLLPVSPLALHNPHQF